MIVNLSLRIFHNRANQMRITVSICCNSRAYSAKFYFQLDHRPLVSFQTLHATETNLVYNGFFGHVFISKNFLFLRTNYVPK